MYDYSGLMVIIRSLMLEPGTGLYTDRRDCFFRGLLLLQQPVGMSFLPEPGPVSLILLLCLVLFLSSRLDYAIQSPENIREIKRTFESEVFNQPVVPL